MVPRSARRYSGTGSFMRNCQPQYGGFFCPGGQHRHLLVRGGGKVLFEVNDQFKSMGGTVRPAAH